MTPKELVKSSLRTRLLRVWKRNIVGDNLTKGQHPSTIIIPADAAPKDYIVLGDDESIKDLNDLQGYF